MQCKFFDECCSDIDHGPFNAKKLTYTCEKYHTTVKDYGVHRCGDANESGFALVDSCPVDADERLVELCHRGTANTWVIHGWPVSEATSELRFVLNIESFLFSKLSINLIKQKDLALKQLCCLWKQVQQDLVSGTS